MSKTRAQTANLARLRISILDHRIKRIYVVKSITYGKYKDVFDYSKVQVTWNSRRDNHTKKERGEKSDKTISRIRNNIYRIIEANKERQKGTKAVFFTLTSRDQEKELKTANKNIKQLMKRLKKRLGFAPLYIIVPEFHKSGAIHYHGVFFNVPYINVIDFKENLWKKGYVDLRLPKKIKSVARYLCKYLTKDTIAKLPLNEKAYFTSRGLIRPYTDYTDEIVTDTMKPLEASITNNYIKTKYLCKI